MLYGGPGDCWLTLSQAVGARCCVFSPYFAPSCDNVYDSSVVAAPRLLDACGFHWVLNQACLRQIPGGFPETMGQYNRRSCSTELESTANASDPALAHQSYAIRNMLSSRVLIAGKYARAKMLESKVLGIILTRKICNNLEVLSCCECGEILQHIEKSMRSFMVYLQRRAMNSLVFAALRTPRRKHRDYPE